MRKGRSFLVVLVLVFVGADAYGLCDIVHVLSSWKTPCPCTFDYNHDNSVDLLDIVFVLANWDGSSSCDNTPPPVANTTWSVGFSSPANVTVCNLATINAMISFTGATKVKGFILQGDAPINVATIVPGSVTLGGKLGWDSSLCQLYTIQGYTYFSCFGGVDLSGGDVLQVSYTVQNLRTGIGIYKTEITTYPPLQISSPVALDMLCGSTTTTTTLSTTTPPPVFAWVANLSGPGSLCGSIAFTYVVNVNVLSGVGFPFLISSEFIRNEGLAFASTPQSSSSQVTCAFSSKAFSCDGVADRSFTITFTLVRQGSLTTGSATLTVLTGLENTNQFDQIATLPVTYGPAC